MPFTVLFLTGCCCMMCIVHFTCISRVQDAPPPGDRTAQHSTAQHTTWHSGTHHSIAQHNNARHSATLRSTAPEEEEEEMRSPVRVHPPHNPMVPAGPL